MYEGHSGKGKTREIAYRSVVGMVREEGRMNKQHRKDM
jgi:hypothetical protein